MALAKLVQTKGRMVQKNGRLLSPTKKIIIIIKAIKKYIQYLPRFFSVCSMFAQFFIAANIVRFL
jgi:hypothetical protein